MGSLPPAIFFINGDITYPPSLPVFVGADPKACELLTLQTRLLIDDTITKAEFDARVLADPNYPTIIHLQGMRILVVLPDFSDGYNRDYADVILFLHQGLADVECSRFGPPGQSYAIQRINMYELIRASKNNGEVCLPFGCGMGGCECCKYPFYCDRDHTFSGEKICRKCHGDCKCGCCCGLIDNMGRRLSPVHLPNCDKETNSCSFVHRK